MKFVIVDTEDGFEVAELNDDGNPVDAAYEHRGFLADEEFYTSYQDAYDAMAQMQEIDVDGESSPAPPPDFDFSS